MTSRIALLNTLALSTALAAAAWFSLRSGPPAPADAPLDPTPQRKAFTRIVSASPVADGILYAIVDQSRIVAYTSYSQGHGFEPERFGGKTGIAGIHELEKILDLKPDLVLVHHVGDMRPLHRLRQAHIHVVDLGVVTGVDSLLDNVRTIADLVGERAAGEALIERTRRALKTTADSVPVDRGHRAIYVTVVGRQVYGGTVGTTFHDLLNYAGLVDQAATTKRGSPSYSAEELLALDPEWIVTGAGMGAMLCARPGLNRLRACAAKDRIVELDNALLGAGGLEIVQAVNALHRAVYDQPRPTQ